jgi:hypothetical protein
VIPLSSSLTRLSSHAPTIVAEASPANKTTLRLTEE